MGQILQYVPFIRMLGLNGSLVRGQDKVGSDIDFLIVVKRDRLYTARFFATILTELTGYRRKGGLVAGRVCLNCYLPDTNLKIVPVNPKSRQKVAAAYKYLIALVDDGGVEARFFEQNKWFSRYQVTGARYNSKLKNKLRHLINGRINSAVSGEVGPLRARRWGESLLLGRFGDRLESILMNWQVKRILAGKKKGDEIICKKNEIRLHPKKG